MAPIVDLSHFHKLARRKKIRYDAVSDVLCMAWRLAFFEASDLVGQNVIGGAWNKKMFTLPFNLLNSPLYGSDLFGLHCSNYWEQIEVLNYTVTIIGLFLT